MLGGVRDMPQAGFEIDLSLFYKMYTVHESILLIAEMLNCDVHAPIAAEPM
jgi:hypothetical protein